MQASSGGTLRIRFTNIDNTSGTIQALNNSTVIIESGRIIGGTISSSGTGVVQLVGNVTLDSLTNAGLLRIGRGFDAIVSDTIINNGTIDFESPGFVRMRSQGDVTIAGTGVVAMNSSTGHSISGLSATDVLTNAAGHTIRGQGTIGGVFDNHGLVAADTLGGLTVTARSNSGTMEASSRGTLIFRATDLDNTSGTIQALDASRVRIDQGARIIGGTLASTSGGTIDFSNATRASRVGTLANNGVLSLGAQNLVVTNDHGGCRAMSAAGRM
jgi:adhesin HecA-like repeat protein